MGRPSQMVRSAIGTAPDADKISKRLEELYSPMIVRMVSDSLLLRGSLHLHR